MRNFFRERQNSKFCLKFGLCAPIFGARGNNLTKLFQVTCREAGMITWVQFFGGLPPLKFGRGKPAKIYHDFTQLHISIANISGTDEDIDKRKTALSTTIPPTLIKKLVKFKLASSRARYSGYWSMDASMTCCLLFSAISQTFCNGCRKVSLLMSKSRDFNGTRGKITRLK